MLAIEVLRSKISSPEELQKKIVLWRFKDQTIVFTNGCFDILHQGHIDYLAKASDEADRLVVGVNSDDSVKMLNKGPERPIQDQDSRALLIASLHFVDAVVIFNEDTPLQLIKSIQPDVLVKGSDYQLYEIVGHDVVLKNGGEVKQIDFLEGFSTSTIIQKIKDDES